MEMELKKEEMKQNARLKEEELKVKQALMAPNGSQTGYMHWSVMYIYCAVKKENNSDW